MKLMGLSLVFLFSIAFSSVPVESAPASCTLENNPRYTFDYDTSVAVATVTFRPSRCFANLEGPLVIYGMMGRDIGIPDPTADPQTHVFGKCQTDRRKCVFELELEHPAVERALYFGYFDFDVHDSEGSDLNGSIDFSLRCTSLLAQGSCTLP